MAKRFIFIFVCLFSALLFQRNVFAYPQAVKGTVNVGISQGDGGLIITQDNRYLGVGHTDLLKIVDLATMALQANQPPQGSTTDGTDGNIKGLGYYPASEQIFAAQDDGDVLAFSLGNITVVPISYDVQDSTSFFPFAINSSVGSASLFLCDNKNSKVYVTQIGSTNITNTIDLKTDPIAAVSSFDAKDMTFVSATNEIYVGTDIGVVLYASAGGTTSAAVLIDDTKNAEYTSLIAHPDGSRVYAVDTVNNKIEIIYTSSHTLGTSMDVVTTDNTGFRDIQILKVLKPAGAYYGYVSGEKGITVFDAASDELIDIDTSSSDTVSPIPTSYYGYLMPSDDGYLYMSSAGGEISVVSETPYITVSSVKYYDSTGAETTVLKQGGTVKLTWQSDEAGTYETRCNGGLTKNGSLLTDTNGQTGGSVAAATSTDVTFAYDTNSSIFQEGTNNVFFFVVDSDNLTGRLAKAVTVDLPPGTITIEDTGFGNGRIYLYFSRLTASDINHYNMYVSTDPLEVRTMTTVSASISQPSSGSTVTGVVSGLANGSVYYMAVEGVDNNSNVGPRAYLKSDGSLVYNEPQVTVGPVGYSGETGGCSLGDTSGGVDIVPFAILMLLVSGLFFVRGKKALLIAVVLLCCAASDLRAEERSPQWWSMELKGGFWMPTNSNTKKFFSKCCNMVAMAEGGFLYKGAYGVELGVGVMGQDGRALGSGTGAVSADTFSMLLIPMETSLVWRADYMEEQILVPYIKGGADYVFFRENTEGAIVKGLKTGMHAIGGLQILMEWIDADSSLEMDYGINDFYITMEAKYGWINSFGKTGLDLSGMTYSMGLLFEF